MQEAVLQVPSAQPRLSAVDAPGQQDRGSLVLQPLYSARLRLYEVVFVPEDRQRALETLMVSRLAACRRTYPTAELDG